MTETSKKLNVVFHGTFLFCWEKDKVTVKIPNVDMHAYFAGNWQPGELRPLKQGGEYRLQNIPPQKTLADPAGADYTGRNLIFKAGLATVQPPGLRKIILPRPSRVTGLQNMTLQNAFFSSRPADMSIPKDQLATVHAFTYDLDGAAPSFDNLEWAPDFHSLTMAGKGPAQCVANLHIFADPPVRMQMDNATMAHPTTAFQDLTSLLDSPDIRAVKFAYPVSHPMPIVEPSIKAAHQLGMRTIEIVGLAESNLLSDKDIPGDLDKAMKACGQTGDVATGHYCLSGGHGG